MQRLTHRELRNDSAAVLRQVKDGESYEVTNHGEVVAVLLPAPHATRTDLRVRRARLKGGFAGLPRVRRQRTVQSVLDDLREDR
jgi:prevent-host-death family protein